MIKLGLFYQSGYRIEACYHALNQFRKHYPDAPVALYEDNTRILKPVSDKFNCVYNVTDVQGYNDPNSGRPAFNLKTTLAWIDRVYEACTTTLSEVDWVMNFEDDVWFIRPIDGEPPFDLSGIGGYGWGEDLYLHLDAKVRGTYGCGGSIFNRLKFIEAYNSIKDMDWELMDSLSKNPKPSEWTDSALTLMFIYSKFSAGSWSELAQYRNTKVPHLHDREGWPGSMEDLEIEQNGVAVVHCWKPYYYPTPEETKEVYDNL